MATWKRTFTSTIGICVDLLRFFVSNPFPNEVMLRVLLNRSEKLELRDDEAAVAVLLAG